MAQCAGVRVPAVKENKRGKYFGSSDRSEKQHSPRKQQATAHCSPAVILVKVYYGTLKTIDRVPMVARCFV